MSMQTQGLITVTSPGTGGRRVGVVEVMLEDQLSACEVSRAGRPEHRSDLHLREVCAAADDEVRQRARMSIVFELVFSLDGPRSNRPYKSVERRRRPVWSSP
jgi:hypothetical protein